MGAILVYKFLRHLFLVTSVFILLLTTQGWAQLRLTRPRPDHKNYTQCLTKTSNPTNALHYKGERGHLGLFQFSLQHAYEGGLCSNPIPVMSGQQNWSLCDYKGPVAQQLGIKNEMDLRYGENALQAQFILLNNVMNGFDQYIYEKKYDLLYGRMVNGIPFNQEILRGLLLSYGKLITDEFINGRHPVNGSGNTPYTIAACLEQCMISEGKQWYCSKEEEVKK